MNNILNELTAHPLFTGVIKLSVALVAILLLVRFAQMLASNKIADKELRFRTRKGFSLVGYLLALLAAIVIFSNQLSNLPVLLGLLGVGVGFALREFIQSLFGWLVISFGGMYKIGDRIRMGGVMGDVMDIGPLTTNVMECGDWVNSDLYNGRMAHLPNNLVLREPVLNYTSDLPFLWDEIVVPVRSDSDHRLARKIIEQAGRDVQRQMVGTAHELWDNFVRHHHADEASLEPVVTLSFDANWIEFTLRYVVDYRSRRSTKSKLFSAILDAFAATEGKVRIAAPKVQLIDTPALQMQYPAGK